MNMNYNPQIEIEITEINADGSESPIIGLLKEFADTDYRHHDQNKPLTIKASIQKSLGSMQNTCALEVFNAPIIEAIRQDPERTTAEIAKTFYRLRVWAWHDDNGTTTKTARPNIPPAFVGDVLDGFPTPKPSSTTDSSFRIEAISHSWLATSGKMRETWQPNTDWATVTQDIFDYIISKGYGRETYQATPKSVIENIVTLPLLQAKTFQRHFNMNRNPMETLNDFCRELDLVWGFENNIPYIISRSTYFDTNELNQIAVEDDFDVPLKQNTGKIGLTSFSTMGFSASGIFDPNFILGVKVSTNDNSQIDSSLLESIGRINELSINLDNEQGHTVDINASYISESTNDVRLPKRRDDTSGRHYQ